MKIYDFNGQKNICGARLKAVRRARGLSQEQLAAKLQLMGIGIERDSVSRMELGTRFIADYELMALCRILDVTPDELLGLS